MVIHTGVVTLTLMRTLIRTRVISFCVVQVRAQDIGTLTVGVARTSEERREKVWGFVLNHTDLFKARFGGSASDQELAVQRLLVDVASGFASQSALTLVEKYFFGIYGSGGLPQFVAHAIDEIVRNIKTMQILREGLCKLL